MTAYLVVNALSKLESKTVQLQPNQRPNIKWQLVVISNMICDFTEPNEMEQVKANHGGH